MLTTTKKTFSVTTNELIKNFIASTMDLLQCNLEIYYKLNEFSLDLESFSVQLKRLTQEQDCFSELCALFREGYSAMLISSPDLEVLEKLEKDNEDYQLLVMDSNERCLGVLQKDDISW